MVEISDNPNDDVRKTSSEVSKTSLKLPKMLAEKKEEKMILKNPNSIPTKCGRQSLELNVSCYLFQSFYLYYLDIDLLSREIKSEPILFPCRFQAVFINFNPKTHSFDHAQKLGFSISDHMRELVGDDKVCGTCGSNFTVSVTMQSKASCITNQNFDTACFWQCGSVIDSDFDVDLKNDELVDEFLASVLVGGEKCSYSTGKVYSVVVLNTDGEIKAMMGKHRHGWILGKISVVNAVKTIAEVFVKVFINGGKEEGFIHGEFLCDAWCSASGNYIVLCNVISFDLRSRGFI
ncbi:hypothetical protein Nepgr_022827 [Nepenthes gracilis]|uniref:Uncharacterized protein n=1 Tax=Nepenthes gracilis TaxID=150966 RepID=A0AAD3XYI5_NEPGR|nr:hypothetical protein Nepgr_022827 [Nepenthes gracilis]